MGSSRQFLSFVKRLIDPYEDEITVVGVNLDSEAQVAENAMAAAGLASTTVHYAGPWQENPVVKAFQLPRFPAVIVINRDGTVRMVSMLRNFNQLPRFEAVLEKSIEAAIDAGR